MNDADTLAESSPAEVDIDRVVSGFSLSDHAPVLSSSTKKTTSKSSTGSSGKEGK